MFGGLSGRGDFTHYSGRKVGDSNRTCRMGKGELFAGNRWGCMWQLCTPLSGRSDPHGAFGFEPGGFAQDSDRE